MLSGINFIESNFKCLYFILSVLVYILLRVLLFSSVWIYYSQCGNAAT